MAGVALATDLMGVGFSAVQASLIGDTLTTGLAGVGTAQSGAAQIVSSVTTMTTSSGQTAAVLPSTWPLLSTIFVYNNSSTAALVFPAGTNTIDNGSASASVSIAQNRGRLFLRISATAWVTIYGA